MKKVILFMLLLAITANSDAQLFNKLKDRAKKAIEPTSSNGSASNSQPGIADASEKKSDNKKSSLPPEGDCKVVFSLASDENFLHDESQVLAQNSKLHYSFVVQNKAYEYFLIEDGNRSSPFKEAPLKSMRESDEESGNSKDDELTFGTDKKDPVAMQFSKTINGKLFLVFNAKNYGPYDNVARMILSPDKKQFFALVTIGSENAMMAKMGMGNTFMVNEGTLKQKAGSGSFTVPMKFSVSNGFKHCMATVMDQKTQKIISATSAGKQQEGDMSEMYSGASSTTFVNDDGNVISIPAQSPTQVLVNGKEAASFKVPIKSMNRLFLTPDISKSVYYENGKIYRADGTEESLTGVLFPKVVTNGTETAVYYFKLFKNESGVRDVYLCKKVF